MRELRRQHSLEDSTAYRLSCSDDATTTVGRRRGLACGPYSLRGPYARLYTWTPGLPDVGGGVDYPFPSRSQRTGPECLVEQRACLRGIPKSSSNEPSTWSLAALGIGFPYETATRFSIRSSSLIARLSGELYQ